jgi:hypothetical protein
VPAHLLTTLGTGDHTLARWRLCADARTYQTHYAPIATAASTGDVARVTRVRVVSPKGCPEQKGDYE